MKRDEKIGGRKRMEKGMHRELSCIVWMLQLHTEGYSKYCVLQTQTYKKQKSVQTLAPDTQVQIPAPSHPAQWPRPTHRACFLLWEVAQCRAHRGRSVSVYCAGFGGDISSR